MSITLGKSKEQKQVTDYTNQPYAVAKAGLEGAGFRTKKVEQASDSVPKDSVISQDPEWRPESDRHHDHADRLDRPGQDRHAGRDR